MAAHGRGLAAARLNDSRGIYHFTNGRTRTFANRLFICDLTQGSQFRYSGNGIQLKFLYICEVHVGNRQMQVVPPGVRLG